jgi:hypothetical protein
MKLESFKQEGKIDYQLTPMNTLIEGDLKDLFEVVLSNFICISAIYLLTLGPSVPTGIITTSTIAII